MIVYRLWQCADANTVIALRRGFGGTSDGGAGGGQHRLGQRDAHGFEPRRCRAGRKRAKGELKGR